VLSDFLLSKNMDQRICIKFCVKNKIKCSETLEMLTVAYGETVLSKKNVYKWYKLFQDGREDAMTITIREVAEDVGISLGYVRY